ncbi:MAG: TonB-dependent receptor [Gammaproteobacteria bacterium]|nr:TonB-dependent receptor [Gammaproteobacteria bacterium]
MTYKNPFSPLPVALAVSIAIASSQGTARAQASAEQPDASAQNSPSSITSVADVDDAIDEVVVTGRFMSSSQKLVNERLGDAFAADMLGADSISRLGDSTVAAALRRVPGLTLVQDKYVYIRGLGERYSQSTLNGAQIPSPDLTRNVIPLDVFPTSVVESLRVQKAWSPAVPANFGGGAVAIRTKSIPDAFTLSFDIGLGGNSANPSKVSSYRGGSDDKFGTDDGTRALSPTILDGIATYQGNPSVQNIFSLLSSADTSATLFDAETENRALATSLNRDIGLKQESVNPDYQLRANVGNRFTLNDDWELGFNFGGSYQTDWRYRETFTADFGVPDEQNGIRKESTRNINIAGNLNFGVSFTPDHEISTTTLALRNTDDETEVFDFFNENRPRSGGIGFRDYRLQFEERNMLVNQVRGTHYFGEDTRRKFKILDGLLGWLPEQTRVTWFFSDSEADTEIPNQAEIASETTIDRDTGSVLSENVRLGSSSGDFRFTELDDEVQNYGWSGMLPLEFDGNYVEFSGGYDHARKARTYRQSQFSLGYLEVSDIAVLQGPLDEVFSDENLLASIQDPDPANPVPGSMVYSNNAVFDRQGANTNSYIAATMTDAIWGQLDWTFDDTWRIAAGGRWEDYRQAAVDWNPFGFSPANPQVTTDEETLQNGVFSEDKFYPSVGLTYMGDLWADTFQVRLGYSETTVRPDLREITDASYIDPITGDLVRGNTGVVPSDVSNVDLRTEWFFTNGNNFTVTAFYKEIDNPIEFFEIPASDTTIAREIVNADSAEIYGVEIEGLVGLGFFPGYFDTMFVQGNVTLQDSELVAGPNANSPTNPERPLTGASDYVANVMLGFDAPNARHTASLIYNVFGERLFVAGRNGAPDGYEQPFHSLDLTYFWYPTDTITFKVKAQNLLGETIEIQRQGVTTFREDPGTTVSVSFSWAL